MIVRVEYGASPGDHGGMSGFWIYKHVHGGPTAGVENLCWTNDAGHAQLICSALELLNPKRSLGWKCSHCDELNDSSLKCCGYCGTKPEGRN